MNKELIKKYKAEFDHWLNGGSVLVKMSTGWEPVIVDYSWHLNDKPYVINDEYIEFRKAGAEGKQLQVSYNGGKTWFDKSYRKISWSKSQLVRIKPERYKVKVGDWVRAPSGCIYQINETNILHGTEHFIPWQPEPGEYFWYHNDLVKFHETQTNAGLLLRSARGCSYYPAEKNFEDYCEPFIGKLPSNLKDINAE